MGEKPLDNVLRAASTQERRKVLMRLLDEEVVTIGSQKDSMTIASLLHDHMPRLADFGMVEYSYDGEEFTVERGDNWEDVKPLIEFIRDNYSEVQ